MANLLYDTLFGRHAGKDTPFLILPSNDAQTQNILTHDAFLKLAAQYAHAFRAAGVQVGDRIAVQVTKSPQSLAIYAACVQAGIIFLPLNVDYTAPEVSYFVTDSKARLLVCDPSNQAALQTVADAAGADLKTLDAQGQGTLPTLAATQPDTFQTADRGADDLAAFLYTSGTTGRSKGAMMSQMNLLSNAQTLVDCWKFTDSDVLLHALPIFHTHGLFVATNVMLLSGGAMIFLPTFTLDAMIRFMPQATSVMGVPTFYTRLLGDPRFDRDLTQHMRLFISGSAPLLAETHIRFSERTGHRILERYGMTETNMNTSNPYDGERRAGTVGFPVPGVELKITDPDTGETLPQGNIGLIEVRGPNVFKGYWNMPEKTAEDLRANGFLITGDLGSIDADGYVSIVGRSKDLIISGGYNIYPKEVELVLDDQPGILESAVIGVPHPDFGETPVAVLVAMSETTLDTNLITTAIGLELARFKQPKRLFVVPHLPRNTMGKVQKNLLRETYKDLFN